MAKSFTILSTTTRVGMVIGIGRGSATTGNDAINVPLSYNRAKAVVDLLVSDGIPRDHITSRGLSAADPVASNGTSDGRAQNRRVVIVVC